MRLPVIGDGPCRPGMAFEAMNNAGHLKKRRLFVILKRQRHSIAASQWVRLSSYPQPSLLRASPFQEFKAGGQRGQSACCRTTLPPKVPRRQGSDQGFARGAAPCSKRLGFRILAPSTGTIWISCCQYCARVKATRDPTDADPC